MRAFRVECVKACKTRGKQWTAVIVQDRNRRYEIAKERWKLKRDRQPRASSCRLSKREEKKRSKFSVPERKRKTFLLHKLNFSILID